MECYKRENTHRAAQIRLVQSQQNAFCALAQFLSIIGWTTATLFKAELPENKVSVYWIFAIISIIIPGLISMHGIYAIGINQKILNQSTLLSLLLSVIYTSMIISLSMAKLLTIFFESKNINLALIQVISPMQHGLILIFACWAYSALYFVKKLIKINLKIIKTIINKSKNSKIGHCIFYFILFLLFCCVVKFSDIKKVNYMSKAFGILSSYHILSQIYIH